MSGNVVGRSPPDVAENLFRLQQLSSELLKTERGIFQRLFNHTDAQRRQLVQALRSLSQPIADANKPYLSEEAVQAMLLVKQKNFGEAAGILRSLELKLGLRHVNPLDHANAGLIASIILLTTATYVASSIPGWPIGLGSALFGGGVGNICYVTLQLIPDRTHKRGPDDLLHVIWRTVGATLLGCVVYGLFVSHLIRLPLEADTAKWGLFSISFLSGFAGRLTTDIVAALKGSRHNS